MSKKHIDIEFGREVKTIMNYNLLLEFKTLSLSLLAKFYVNMCLTRNIKRWRTTKNTYWSKCLLNAWVQEYPPEYKNIFS